MDHTLHIRKLSDEQKAQLQSELLNAGWKIAGTSSGIQDPNNRTDTIASLVLSCPEAASVGFPGGFHQINTEACSKCGLPKSVFYDDF
ncbi:hypothetical protein [Brevibacillus choshinensis]|uniref:DUF1737 domain-containing protein n=1 Tax=Brevibacillus choshinensis TaxID=54911 RepID=A0ABX7FTK1_BRECH|nr:hypothetical protein [Brevibacillus choshinensis]QRG68602.1 hypothetical protein JNE38_05470 [Brevibacillus choshinensis]